MKKTCIFFVFIFSVISSQAQWRDYPRPSDSINLRDYDERYFFPDAVREGCTEIPLDAMDPELFTIIYAPINYMTYCVGFIYPNVVPDFAQPYGLSDTTIRIAGISGLIEAFWQHGRDTLCVDSNNTVSCFLEIRDATLENIMASVEVPINTTTKWSAPGSSTSLRYHEAFFDDVLTIGRDFYVVFHTPDSVDIDFWGTIAERAHYSAYQYQTSCFFYNVNNECANSTQDALIRDGNYEWMKFTYDWYAPGSHYMFYLFPILAEEGSWDGGYVDISDYVKIFPNPAADIVNVNCGYKMNSLEMYNELGIKVKSAKPESHNYGLNISELPKGIYFVEIFTSKGKTTKKLLKQ